MSLVALPATQRLHADVRLSSWYQPGWHDAHVDEFSIEKYLAAHPYDDDDDDGRNG